jgi:DtxR family Mn-dependent transcriptional regulator
MVKKGKDNKTEQNPLSSSMQDYLEAILDLETEGGNVRVTDVANRLNIAKASVNQTIAKFKEMDLVRQQSYGPLELTETGRELAEKIRQNHDMLRHFLTEVLGVDPEVAEKDACQMEHSVSALTMEKLTEFLKKNGYL